MENVEALRLAHEAVLERIVNSAERAGRDAAEVRLIAVTKTHPVEVVRDAVAAGMTVLGENKPQELSSKASKVSGVTWCAIGRLQRNKAKEVAAWAQEFHALDSLRLADALQRRLEAADRMLEVFVQVNTSGEVQKGGIAPVEAAEFLGQLADYDRLHVRGLMTMARNSPEEAVVRSSFVQLRELRDTLQPDFPTATELSMGMFRRFEWAIEEGATSVRVGSALFGPRGEYLG
ncbi:Pyridoxal phosphate enzyme, YggS family [Corynebacterium pseudotuberculosis]|uniref:YggS family pyridoxal phosphate-dependent enzyme n=1 Tax=Corynebacterium pseudotuberculosis TaxID=1719 RepID=UPI0009475063|nr:YggS family pyridoxal phosphate-dependent enzyme [Corynebacterium pseudotuberculosis]APQ54630.1 Pyridoxal phosphate enzyme, YggS family [Corynebacterium pseudotuberculosis]